jgi:RIO-like serine/threonine protein kinase
LDTIDFKIMKAITDLKVPFPKTERINSLVDLDPEELGARLGVLEMLGYVKTQNETGTEVSSLPNGICAVGLTNLGKRALAGPRW